MQVATNVVGKLLALEAMNSEKDIKIYMNCGGMRFISQFSSTLPDFTIRKAIIQSSVLVPSHRVQRCHLNLTNPGALQVALHTQSLASWTHSDS